MPTMYKTLSYKVNQIKQLHIPTNNTEIFFEKLICLEIVILITFLNILHKKCWFVVKITKN